VKPFLLILSMDSPHAGHFTTRWFLSVTASLLILFLPKRVQLFDALIDLPARADCAHRDNPLFAWHSFLMAACLLNPWRVLLKFRQACRSGEPPSF
jgi:hypothetical protein